MKIPGGPGGRGADYSEAWRLVSEITAHAAAIADSMSAGASFDGDNDALLQAVLSLIQLEQAGPVQVLPLPVPDVEDSLRHGLAVDVWRRVRDWPRCRQCGTPVGPPATAAVLETKSGDGVWSRDAPHDLLRVDVGRFSAVHMRCARWLPERFVWWGVVVDRL